MAEVQENKAASKAYLTKGILIANTSGAYPSDYKDVPRRSFADIVVNRNNSRMAMRISSDFDEKIAKQSILANRWHSSLVAYEPSVKSLLYSYQASPAYEFCKAREGLKKRIVIAALNLYDPKIRTLIASDLFEKKDWKDRQVIPLPMLPFLFHVRGFLGWRAVRNKISITSPDALLVPDGNKIVVARRTIGINSMPLLYSSDRDLILDKKTIEDNNLYVLCYVND